MGKRAMLLLVACVALAAAVTAAGASAHGKKKSSGTGVVALVSDLTNSTTADDASSLTFNLPSGTTFADLKQLSTQFNPIAGGCGGGSPRFSITLANNPNEHVFVYLGPLPNFTGCALNTWQSSGELIGSSETRFDTSQVGGTFYDTYAHALALIGSQPISKVDLVVDSGWFFTPKVQAVLVRDVQINNQTFVTGNGGMSPAQLCKAELNALGASGFEHKWGSNHNLKNAFGKCVSKTAHSR